MFAFASMQSTSHKCVCLHAPRCQQRSKMKTSWECIHVHSKMSTSQESTHMPIKISRYQEYICMCFVWKVYIAYALSDIHSSLALLKILFLFQEWFFGRKWWKRLNFLSLKSGQKFAAFIMEITIFRDCIDFSCSINQSLDKTFGCLTVYFGHFGVYILSDNSD